MRIAAKLGSVHTLNFQNSMQGEESFEVIPNSGFSVSRTAHRNNTSNYFIGLQKSNFSEVTDLLKGKGIDLDNNRFLILQVGSCIYLSVKHDSSVCNRVQVTVLHIVKSSSEDSVHHARK